MLFAQQPGAVNQSHGAESKPLQDYKCALGDFTPKKLHKAEQTGGASAGFRAVKRKGKRWQELQGLIERWLILIVVCISQTRVYFCEKLIKWHTPYMPPLLSQLNLTQVVKIRKQRE